MERSVAFLSALVSASLLAGACQAAEEKKCTLAKLGEFRVTMQGLRGFVAGKINGVDTSLLLDSGAFFSSLESSARDKFNLKRGVMPPNLIISGTGGMANLSVGKASTFEIGSFKISDVEFLVGGPDFGAADGVLGQNIIGGTDAEYDFANGVVRMYAPKGCENANMAYWAADKPYSVIPLIEGDTNGSREVMGTAKVNGRDIRVVFDTGAQGSVIRKASAEKAGFKSTAPGVVAGGISGGFGSGTNENWIAPFDSFEIGGEKINNTRMRVATINLRDADMLLGADFFLSHRIYISKSQKKIYFTYNGGPIFRFGAPTRPGPQAEAPGPLAAATQAPQAGPAGAPPSEPTDADGFARRAAASAARRDYAAAVTDLTRAIQLKPEAEYYFQRASAHQASRQPLMAIADFDETLKLKPDHVMALVNRGEMFLNNRNVSRAKADFDAAVKLPDTGESIGARIGADYLRAGFADEAIAQYDGWLAAHPRDQKSPSILAGRCYARALGNRELDKAMEDCNTAVRGAPNSVTYEYRGLVYLRMGQFDKAISDYDEALKRQPRSPGPLYGRGLAKVKKGQASEGKADMQAAVALDPTLSRRAQQFGLVE